MHMSKLSQKKPNRKVVWMARNKGILARIADELNLSRPFVGEVFWGTRSSRSGDVERKLAEAKAPGFKSESSPSSGPEQPGPDFAHSEGAPV